MPQLLVIKRQHLPHPPSLKSWNLGTRTTPPTRNVWQASSTHLSGQPIPSSRCLRASRAKAAREGAPERHWNCASSVHNKQRDLTQTRDARYHIFDMHKCGRRRHRVAPWLALTAAKSARHPTVLQIGWSGRVFSRRGYVATSPQQRVPATRGITLLHHLSNERLQHAAFVPNVSLRASMHFTTNDFPGESLARQTFRDVFLGFWPSAAQYPDLQHPTELHLLLVSWATIPTSDRFPSVARLRQRRAGLRAALAVSFFSSLAPIQRCTQCT